MKLRFSSQCDRGGTRTRSLRIRSPTPYPLGHTTHKHKMSAIFREIEVYTRNNVNFLRYYHQSVSQCSPFLHEMIQFDGPIMG
jgi:hypothetical protein